MLEEYDFSVGVLVAAFPDIKLDEAKSALKAHLPAKHQKLISNNYAAMDRFRTREGADEAVSSNQ